MDTVTAAASLAATEEHPPIPARQVAAAVAGNALEFYDFTIYAAFAPQLANAFFPNASAFASLMLTLATYGAGFATRPLGAIVIGRWADRRGRRPAMLFSFALMGVTILGLAFTPTTAQIGLAAPTLVLFWRLLQGFAIGGEMGPTTAFLVEAAPPARRGFFGSWQGASQNMAYIVGGLVGVILARTIGEAGVQAWGWRAAFLVGAAVLPFGLILRRQIPETLHRPEPRLDVHPDGATLLHALPVLLQGLGLIAATTISTYVFQYLTTYARTTLHMDASVALAATFVSGVGGLIGGLIGGVMSDRFGRRALLIWPRLVFLLVTWPVFDWIVREHDALSLLAGTAIMTFFSALSTASLYVAFSESLRKEVRVLGMGGVYAGAVAVFGGTTQPIVLWINHVTGDPRSIAWYTLVATLVGLIAALTMRETAHSVVNRNTVR